MYGQDRTYELGPLMGKSENLCLSEAEVFSGTRHAVVTGIRRAYFDGDGERIYPYDSMRQFSIGKSVQIAGVKKELDRMKTLLETKYRGFEVYGHRGICLGRYAGAGKNPVHPLRVETGDNLALKDLALPFAEFCRRNNTAEILPFLMPAFTGLGFGSFEDIPASYVLKHLGRSSMCFDASPCWTWNEGTQGFMEAINRKLKHPARTGTEVLRISRGDDGSTILVGLRDASGDRTESFDRLIITSPLDAYLDLVDSTAPERVLFKKIRHDRVLRFLAVFEEGSGPSESGFFPGNTGSDRLGHAAGFYHRWEDLGDACPCTVYGYVKHGDQEVDREEALSRMEEDLRQCGYKIAEKRYVTESDSAPYVSSEDFADGWYEKFDQIQGIRNTFFAGSIASFGDLDQTFASSRELVRRFFRKENG